MFEIVIGENGGGKSYNAMKGQILPALKEGRRVLTNMRGIDDIECHVAQAHYVGKSVKEIEGLIVTFPEHETYRFYELVEPGMLIIIDEAHAHFPATDTKNQKTAYDWVSMEHRQMKCDIAFITQIPSSLNKKFFELASQFRLYAKASHLGMKNSYTEAVYRFDLSKDNRISKSRPIAFKDEVYPTYKGHREDAVEHEERVSHKSIFSSKSVQLLLLLSTVGIFVPVYMLWFSDDALLNQHKTKDSKQKSTNRSIGNSNSKTQAPLSVIPYDSKSCELVNCYVIARDQMFTVPLSVARGSIFTHENRVFMPKTRERKR
jgi:zona occludens toxin